MHILARLCISWTLMPTARYRAGFMTRRHVLARSRFRLPDPQHLTEHLQELARTIAPDFIMIDVAGAYERALTVAAARAHLTIIPTTLSEADVYEAEKTAAHIDQIFASFGQEAMFRLLLTKVQTLQSHGQRHAAREKR